MQLRKVQVPVIEELKTKPKKKKKAVHDVQWTKGSDVEWDFDF